MFKWNNQVSILYTLKLSVILWHLWTSPGPKGLTKGSPTLTRYVPHLQDTLQTASPLAPRQAPLYLGLNLKGLTSLPTYKPITSSHGNGAGDRGTQSSWPYKVSSHDPWYPSPCGFSCMSLITCCQSHVSGAGCPLASHECPEPPGGKFSFTNGVKRRRRKQSVKIIH